jgi:hypothetical protein
VARRTFRFKLYRFVGQTTGEVATVEITARTPNGAWIEAQRLCEGSGDNVDWEHDPNEEYDVDLRADIAEWEEVTEEESTEN